MSDYGNPSAGATREFGHALTNLGFGIADKLLDAEERMQFNAGAEAIDSGLTRFDQDLKTDPNWQDYGNKATQAEDAIWEQVDKSVSNPAAKNRLYDYMVEKRSQHLKAIGDYQNQQRVSESIGTLNATIAAIVADGTTPSEVRKQKLAGLLSDAYETNLIDNPTKGAKLQELGHLIDTQAVSGEAWKIAMGQGPLNDDGTPVYRSYQEFLDDPKNWASLTATEIDKVGDAVFGRIEQERRKQEWFEKANNEKVETELSTAMTNFIFGRTTDEQGNALPVMSVDMLTQARGSLIGESGNNTYETYVRWFTEARKAKAAGDGSNEPNYGLAAPFVTKMADPANNTLAKNSIATGAYTSGALGPVNSEGAVRTYQYLLGFRTNDSRTLTYLYDRAEGLSRPDPINQTPALISIGDSAIMQGMLDEYARKNPKATPTELGGVFDQLQSFFTDKAIRVRVHEVWKTKGTNIIDLFTVGGGKPDMSAVQSFSKNLQEGQYSYLRETTDFKFVEKAVRETQEKDLSDRLKQPRAGTLYKIDSTKTRVGNDGSVTHFDQFGSAYFYDRLEPKKPNEWHWYVSLYAGKDAKGKPQYKAPKVLQ